jgi:alpha-mannosidase
MSDPKDFTLHLIGHGHIDPTWLWRWQEGYEEVRASFRSALDRMNEYPDFKFTASSACFYDWVKACDPDLLDEIKVRVQEGRWELAGGWWIEPDCNIPGGEALVRQGLYAQRFFKSEFGKQATVGFNPDSFGHAGTFPQIYKKMGIDYYCYMRPTPPHEMDYPEGTTFSWRANDGTEILACCLGEDYNSDAAHVRKKALSRTTWPYLNPCQRHVIGFYGVGNHGGGPTKRTIETIQGMQQETDLPDLKFATLHEFFEAFQANADGVTVPTIDRDLQHHARGCYSVHAEIKRLNRRAEHELAAAERFATVAWLVQQHAYPKEAIEAGWKDVLYNQFHDILAGTSIESSYEDSRDQLGAARHLAQEITNESVQTLARTVDTSAEGNTIMVVNPLPWSVKQSVTAPPIVARELDVPPVLVDDRTPSLYVVDDTETPVPVQEVLGERIGHMAYAFTVEVPAMGYRCYHARVGTQQAELANPLEAGRDFLENAWWRIEFDPYDGHICRLYDKKKDVEVLTAGNILAAMVDQSDTWSHGFDEFRVEAGRFGDARLELLELGDVRATLRITSRYGKSTADQFVTIYRDVDTIDCRFRINWQEQYTMLKLAYETTIADGKAHYDTAYGVQERDIEGFEEPGQKWIDLTGKSGERNYGLAVLNDSKYGFDVRGNTMRVTMLRSPAYAHHDRARYDASLPYAIMDQGWHTIRIQLVPHAGDWREAGVVHKAYELNEPALVHVESGHAGNLPQRHSFFGTDTENVTLTVLKQNEDGGEVVVRGYETAGRETVAKIQLPHLDAPIDATFAPHEIKTLRIALDGSNLRTVDLLEE